MGIYLSYRRVPAEKLSYFRTIHDADLLADYMQQDQPAFPDSPIPDPDSQHLDLDKLYPLVDGFLNLANDDSSVFVSVAHGGKPVIDNPAHENDDYLDVVYFLSPEEVQVIARAMRAIPPDEWAERYRILMGDKSIDAAVARSEFPTYDHVIEIMADVRQFFQHAADAGEGILRWYT
jgi:hypothetical protein